MKKYLHGEYNEFSLEQMTHIPLRIRVVERINRYTHPASHRAHNNSQSHGREGTEETLSTKKADPKVGIRSGEKAIICATSR